MGHSFFIFLEKKRLDRKMLNAATKTNAIAGHFQLLRTLLTLGYFTLKFEYNFIKHSDFPVSSLVYSMAIELPS